jgi:myo-inositol-1(or 4)-monophosphatase
VIRDLAGPSLAYRFAQIAAGRIDAGMAAVNAHDWDLAAVDLLVHEAGGRMSGLDAKVLIYNRPQTRHGILLAARADLQEPFIAALIVPDRSEPSATAKRPSP